MLGKMNGLAGQPNRVNKYTSEDKSPCSRPARAAGVTVPGSNGRCPKRQNLPKFASPTTDARVTCCAVPDRRLKRPRSRRPSPKALRSTDSAMASPNSQAPPLAWTVVGETRPPPGPLSAIHPPAWRAHARRIRVETLAIAPRNESARPHGSEKSGFGFVNVVICARDPARRHALSSPMPISPCHCTCFSLSPWRKSNKCTFRPTDPRPPSIARAAAASQCQTRLIPRRGAPVPTPDSSGQAAQL